MRKLAALLLAVTTAMAAVAAKPQPAEARRGAAIAGAIIGGLAIGAILSSRHAHAYYPRRHYYPRRYYTTRYYYGPRYYSGPRYYRSYGYYYAPRKHRRHWHRSHRHW